MHFLFRPFIIFSAFISLSACHHKVLVSNVAETHYIINKDDVDSTMYKNILPYKQKLETQMNEVIAQSEGALIKGDLESPLGNFVCDAVMFETKKILGADSSLADVVILNKGGLRNALPKGSITLGNIFELMPFDNEIVLLRLSGKQFSEMLSKAAEKNGLPEKGFRMTISHGKATEVTVGAQALDSTKTYGVITSDYLANGGDSYTFFINPVERRPLNVKLRDAIIEYCREQSKQGKTLKPYSDGRIQLSK